MGIADDCLELIGTGHNSGGPNIPFGRLCHLGEKSLHVAAWLSPKMCVLATPRVLRLLSLVAGWEMRR